jgi:adenine phosphoribosyltransferase
MAFRNYIREIPDFPAPGVVFSDITPVMADARAFSEAIEAMSAPVRTLEPTHVLGLESKGFIFGSALAMYLGLGFVPARRTGKLPRNTIQEKYGLENETQALEIHTDAFGSGDRVLIVDDVLVTGGTAAAAKRLVERTGAHPVALTLFIELSDLTGREALKGLPVFSLMRC